MRASASKNKATLSNFIPHFIGCDKDLYPPYCKLIAGTDSCQSPEYKVACCCTCHYYS